MTPAAPVLAVDVGGTKLAAALVDDAGGVRRRHEVRSQPTSTGAGDELWSTLLGLIDEVVDGQRVAGVGVGCGGPARWPEGSVSPLNIPAWRDFPLRARLQERFRGVPVRLVNDAIAMAIGEHWEGAAAGDRNVLGVVVSTGVGGGLILDGRVRFGPTGNAGHVGHIVVEADGPVCGCGGRGCLEAVARGPAIVRWALDHGWEASSDDEPDGRALVTAARDGDEVARAAVCRCGEALGVALASTAHLLDLDVVAVGGGIANAGDLLFEPARAAFARHARMDFASRCRIVPATLGPDAGIVGAAALVACGDRYWPIGAD